MTWLQFVASIISSVAWPAVALYFLYLLRDQVAGLAERLEEYSGFGQHMKFRSLVQTAKEKVDETASPPSSPPSPEQPPLGEGPPSSGAAARWEAQEIVPYASVILGYSELERALTRIRSKLGLPRQMNLISVVRDLRNRGKVGQEVVESFNALRLARNAAAHAERTITQEDARNFNYTAERLLGVFNFVDTSLGGEKQTPSV